MIKEAAFIVGQARVTAGLRLGRARGRCDCTLLTLALLLGLLTVSCASRLPAAPGDGSEVPASTSICVQSGEGETVALSSCLRPVSRCEDAPGDASVILRVWGSAGEAAAVQLLCGGEKVLECTATAVLVSLTPGGPPVSRRAYGSCDAGPVDMTQKIGALTCEVVPVPPGAHRPGYIAACPLTPPL